MIDIKHVQKRIDNLILTEPSIKKVYKDDSDDASTVVSNSTLEESMASEDEVVSTKKTSAKKTQVAPAKGSTVQAPVAKKTQVAPANGSTVQAPVAKKTPVAPAKVSNEKGSTVQAHVAKTAATIQAPVVVPENYDVLSTAPNTPRMEAVKGLKIYEAILGACSAENDVCSYKEFTTNMLPYIKTLGYNAVLLLGVVEHGDYASMGTDVTRPREPSSRFGSVEDFLSLVHEAHKLDLKILISTNMFTMMSSDDRLQRTKSVENLEELSVGLTDEEKKRFHTSISNTNLNMFSVGMNKKKKMRPVPTNEMFLQEPLLRWSSRMYDYTKIEAIEYNLTTLKFWLEKFNIDGFRFDTLTPALYTHRYAGQFANNEGLLPGQLPSDCDEATVAFLILANQLAHSFDRQVITIADDWSKFPMLTESIGFDYSTKGDDTSQFLLDLVRKTKYHEWSVDKIFNNLSAANDDASICAIENADTNVKGKRPLKIALLAWETLATIPVGGVAAHVSELGAALQRLGHEVHVFTRSTCSQSKHYSIYGVQHHESTFDLNADFIQEVRNMCNAFVQSVDGVEMFMNQKFDIIHGHDWLVGPAVCALKERGMSRAVVYTMHSTETGRCGNVSYNTGPSASIRGIEGDSCHAADRVICVSGVLAEEVRNHYRIHIDKTVPVYNGIHCHNFDLELTGEDVVNVKAELGIGVMDPTFLFVGRMATQKGPDILVEAFKNVLNKRGDAKLIMVGDGHMREAICVRANEMGILGSIRFTGNIRSGDERLVKIFKSCDAVVVPSRNEPFGIVVLEAWASEKPVIATTCGGPRDFVTHDVDGFLVNPDAGSVSWGMCKILEDFDHARWMGKQGRLKAAFSFSWDVIAIHTERVYLEQLNLHGTSTRKSYLGDCSLSTALQLQPSNMSTVGYPSETTHLGMSILKCLQLLLASSAKNYVNFMGNEFGHSSHCLDMPRPGNELSCEFAKLDWEAANSKDLRFKSLLAFTRAVNHLDQGKLAIKKASNKLILSNEEDKVLVYHNAESSVFVFNLHYCCDYQDYKIVLPFKGKYAQVVASTDDLAFGGTGLVEGLTTMQLDEEDSSIMLANLPRMSVSSGHYNALRQAKQLCDVLVVGVHSDDEIAANKAPPVFKQNERYELLKHIKWIDEIVYDVSYSPGLSTLEVAKADFCIHGDDMPTDQFGNTAYGELDKVGKLQVIKRTEGVSTTDLVGRLLLLTKEHLNTDQIKMQTPTKASELPPPTNGKSSFDLNNNIENTPSSVEDSPQISRQNSQHAMDGVPELVIFDNDQNVIEQRDYYMKKCQKLEREVDKLKTKKSHKSNNKVQLLTTTRRIAEFSTRKAPSVDDKVVYIDGAFDMFHIGHASTLEKAKSFGTYLLVGVFDDSVVNQLKGSNYPVMNLHERVLNVSACKHVDEVIIGAPVEVTQDLITTMNISVVIQGSATRLLQEAESSRTGNDSIPMSPLHPPVLVQKNLLPIELGLFKEIESEWAYLTTDEIAQRIVTNRMRYINRNEKREKLEQSYYEKQKMHLTES